MNHSAGQITNPGWADPPANREAALTLNSEPREATPSWSGSVVFWAGIVAIWCFVLATSFDLPQRWASWLAGVAQPGPLGMVFSVAVGMAAWIAARQWPEEPDGDFAAASGNVQNMEPLVESEQLERVLVEAAERRHYHLRRHLEIGIVRQLDGLSCLVRVLEQRLSADDRPEAVDVAKLRSLVDRTICEAHVLASAAHPPEIETQGLESALRRMAEAAESYQVYCQVVQNPLFSEPEPTAALQLYRVVQMIVERAIRDSNTHHILVELTLDTEAHPAMVVTDRVGQGESPRDLNESELCNLRARSHSIGAALQVDHPEGGLRLTCRLPLSPKNPMLQS